MMGGHETRRNKPKGPDPEQDDGADGQAPESNEDDIGDQDVDYVDRDPKD